jgi:hypothetical protein
MNRDEEDIYVGLFDIMRESALSCLTRDRVYVSVNINWEILHYSTVQFSFYGLTFYNNYLRNPTIFNNIPDDNWIVCPIQFSEKTGGWDIQIGMSGTCKEDQNPFDGMRLELQEELGLEYIGGQISGTFIDQPRTLFFVRIGHTRSISEQSRIVRTANNYDDKTNKISCFVHGTLCELLSVINIQNKTRNYSCNDDNILGLALVSIKTIKNFIHNFIINGKGKGKGKGNGKGKGKGKGVAMVDSDRGDFGKGVAMVDSDRGDFGKGSKGAERFYFNREQDRGDFSKGAENLGKGKGNKGRGKS